MNILKRALSALVAVSILLPSFSGAGAYAAENETISIKNDYIEFSVNNNTGFFGITTLEGHPQKSGDNNMDLLYDGESIETSFTTIHLDGKDYIFGQDYGLFDSTAKKATSTVDLVKNTVTTVWNIKGLEIKQIAYLSKTDNTIQSGNVQLSYEVNNTTDKEANVGIRVMMDNALGEIDAPIAFAQDELASIMKEKVYFEADEDGNVREPGSYLRFIDSEISPKKEAFYTFGNELISTPDRMVVGHWYNLASSKWDYTPDENCAFSSSSNKYGIADTASAIYWNDIKVPAGSGNHRTLIYGVGEFTRDTNVNGAFNVAMTVDSYDFEFKNDKAYKDGIATAHITFDNNLDSSVDIPNAIVRLSCGEGAFFINEESTGSDGTPVYLGVDMMTKELGYVKKGDIITFDCEMMVSVPQEINVIKTEAQGRGNSEDNTSKSVQYVIAPPYAKNYETKFAATEVAPNTFHREGIRNMSVKGVFDISLLNDKTKWSAEFVSVNDENLRYPIHTEMITLVSSNVMGIVHNGIMAEGEYIIEYSFKDELQELFKMSSYKGPHINIVNDPSLQNRSYEYVCVMRTGVDMKCEYTIHAFENKVLMDAFKGKLNSKQEILAELHGSFSPMLEDSEDGQKINGYTALTDYTLNNVTRGKKGSNVAYFKEYSDSLQIKNGVRIHGKDWLRESKNGNDIFSCDWDIEVVQNIYSSLSDGSVKISIGNNTTNALINLGLGMFNANLGTLGKDGIGYNIYFGGRFYLIGYSKTGDKEADGTPVKDTSPRYATAISASLEFDKIALCEDGNWRFDVSGTAGVYSSDIFGASQKEVIALNVHFDNIEGEEEYSGRCVFTLSKKKSKPGIEAKLAFKPVMLSNDESTLLPDSIGGGFTLPPPSGLPIVPGALTLYKFGLEINGICDIVDGAVNHGDASTDEIFAILNKTTSSYKATVGLSFFGAIQLIAIGDAGPNHFNITITGVMKDSPIKITGMIGFKWLYPVSDGAGNLITPAQVTFYDAINLNLLSIIKGSAGTSYTHIFKEGEFLDKNIFVLNFSGGVYVPPMMPFIGGMELLGLQGVVNNIGVKGVFVALGCEFCLVYDWGDDKINTAELYDADAEEGEVLPGNMLYLNTGEPEITLSEANEGSSISVKAEGGNDFSTLAGIEYYGETPSVDEIKLTVNGKEVELTLADNNLQNGNCAILPDEGNGGRILVGLDDTPDGTNTITFSGTSGMKPVSMRTLGFIKSANVNSIKANGDGTVTVTADRSLEGSTVELVYINDKEAYSNIEVEKYTDENGETQYRPYKQVDGNKVILDEEFYKSFTEHRLAYVEVNENTSSCTITPDIPEHANSGDYYLMAVVRSKYGKTTRCALSEPVHYVNKNEPSEIASAVLENAGDENIIVNITDAADANYTGYFVSLYNETDNEYAVSDKYFDFGEDIVLEDLSEAGKTYHAEIRTVNRYSEDGFVTGKNAYKTNGFVPREPQKLDMSVTLDNNAVEGNYIDKNSVSGEKERVLYVTDKTVNVKVSCAGASKCRFVIDGTEQLWIEPNESGKYELSLPELSPGKHSISFEAVNALNDTTKSAPVRFAISGGSPMMLFESSKVDITDGHITVTGKTSGAEAIEFMGETFAPEENGGFSVTAPVTTTKMIESFPITATGYDGQKTTEMITAVNTEYKPINGIALLSDGEDKEAITMKPGETVSLKAMGLTDGEMHEFDGNVDILVTEGSNAASVSESGELKALAAGKAFIKAVYSAGTIVNGGETRANLYEDMVEVNVEAAQQAPTSSISNGANVSYGTKLTLSGSGKIYYTLDGSDPTTESTLYTEPIKLPEGTVTVKTISVSDTGAVSDISSWTYNVTKRTNGGGGSAPIRPTASPEADTVPSPEPATLITASTDGSEPVDYGYELELKSEGGTIYYTTDGTTPDKTSAVYEGPITVKENMKIRAVIWNEGDVYSNIYDYDMKLNPYGISFREDAEKNSLWNGYEDGTFGPDRAITRAETAAILRRATEMHGYMVKDGIFSDTDMWAKDVINELAAADVVNGYEDGTFRPDNGVTRAEFVAMLMRIADEAGTDAGYADADGHWAEKYIAKAAEYGFVNGYEDGTFRPDNVVTRAEVVAIMSRVFGFPSDGTESEYADVTPEHWAFGYIAK